MHFSYMRAEEALSKAKEARSLDGAYMRENTKAILEEIDVVAQTGSTSKFFNYSFHPVVKERLFFLGYNVIEYEKDIETEVSWGNLD